MMNQNYKTKKENINKKTKVEIVNINLIIMINKCISLIQLNISDKKIFVSKKSFNTIKII